VNALERQHDAQLKQFETQRVRQEELAARNHQVQQEALAREPTAQVNAPEREHQRTSQQYETRGAAAARAPHPRAETGPT
jgi:hypothetical protein